jgi:alpha-ketoglutarate-dependent taurine dioxygenase
MNTSVHAGLLSNAAPYRYEALTPGYDFFAWATDNRRDIETQLRTYGAVLFRGFQLARQSVFERLLSFFCSEVIAGYGDLPPEEGSDRVYRSTPYPANSAILFHNESSHMSSWPTRQFFGCVTAAPVGGETPLVDSRRIYQQLPAQVRERFSELGLLYVRRFIPGFDVPWQTFFKTQAPAEVESSCQRRGWRCEWSAGGILTVSQPSQALAQNPVTGEWSFFNQIMLHHPHYLPAEALEALETLLPPGNLPRNVSYGDGSPIETNVLNMIHELHQADSTSFRWREGDVLMLDNMSIAHGRAPFSGSRKIIVGMGDPIEMFR